MPLVMFLGQYGDGVYAEERPIHFPLHNLEDDYLAQRIMIWSLVMDLALGS